MVWGLFLLTSCSLWDTTHAAPLDEPLPFVEGVRTGELENGVRYAILRRASPRKRANLALVVGAGTAHEEGATVGASERLTALAREGTEVFKSSEIDEVLKAGRSSTKAPWVLHDAMTTTYLVGARWADASGGYGRALELLKEWACCVATQTLSQEDQVFRNAAYAPSQLSVVMVGDVEVEQAEEQIRNAFGSLIAANTRALPTPAEPREPTFELIAQPGSAFHEEELLTVGRRSVRRATVETYRERIVRTLALGVLNRRLALASEAREATFLEAKAHTKRHHEQAVTDTLAFSFRPGEQEAALEAVWSEVVRLKQHGALEVEFQGLKKAILDRLKRMPPRTSEQLTHGLAKHLGEGVSLIPRGAEENELARRLAQDLSVEDLNAWLAVAFSGKPGPVWVKDVMERVEATKLSPPEKPLRATTLVEEAPDPVKPASWDEGHSDRGISVRTYPNGVRVWSQPTLATNGSMRVAAVIPGGSHGVPAEAFRQVETSAAVVLASGAGEIPARVINQLMQGNITLAIDIKPTEVRIHGGTFGSGNEEMLLQRLHQVLDDPWVTGRGLFTIQQVRGDALQYRGKQARSLLGEAWRELNWPTDRRHWGVTEDELKALDVGEVEENFARVRAGLGEMEVLVIGALPADLDELLDVWIGSLGVPAGPRLELDAVSTRSKGPLASSVTSPVAKQSHYQVEYWGPHLDRPTRDALRQALSVVVEPELQGIGRGVRASFWDEATGFRYSVSFTTNTAGPVEEAVYRIVEQPPSVEPDAFAQRLKSLQPSNPRDELGSREWMNTVGRRESLPPPAQPNTLTPAQARALLQEHMVPERRAMVKVVP